LKLFHVCSRYTVLSGNPLPADINYFGKCLLGETSIDCFSKTLNQSVRNAELYLDVSPLPALSPNSTLALLLPPDPWREPSISLQSLQHLEEMRGSKSIPHT
jgi:hypothetical protein